MSNDDVVIAAINLDLARGDLPAAADHIIGLQHTQLEAALQLDEGRRQYKNRSRTLDFRFHLLRSLDIDVQDHVVARLELLIDEAASGAVELAVELRPL